MIKKSLISAGALVTAFVLTVGVALAQTASPSPTASPIVSPTSSPTASPSPMVPIGAPATGMGV